MPVRKASRNTTFYRKRNDPSHFQTDSCVISFFLGLVALRAAASRVIARTFSIYRIFRKQNRYNAFAENVLDSCVEKRPVSGAGHDHGK